MQRVSIAIVRRSESCLLTLTSIVVVGGKILDKLLEAIADGLENAVTLFKPNPIMNDSVGSQTCDLTL